MTAYEIDPSGRLGKKLGGGASADVFEWGERQVIKLFHDRIPDTLFRVEQHNAEALAGTDLPVPRFAGRHDVEGRRGLVFERVDGPLMSRSLARNPFKWSASAEQFAHLHRQIHAGDGRALHPAPDALRASIERAAELPDQYKGKVIDLLTSLPDGQSICHFDYHAGNLIVTERGSFVIDWGEARRGNPLADVARTIALLAIDGSTISNVVGRTALRRGSTYFSRQYLRHYLSGRPSSERAELERWIPVVAAATMRNKGPRGCRILMDLIERGLFEAKL